MLSNLCHQRMLSSSVTPFSSCLHSYLASGSFLMSWLFALSDQSIRASVSVLPMNIYDLFPLRLTGLISLLSKGLSRVFSNTTIQKCHTLAFSLLFGSILMSVNDHWKKKHSLTIQISVLFSYNVSICHNFPSKEQVSFNFTAAVTMSSDFGAQENKICHCFHFFLLPLPQSAGTGCH